MPLPSRTDPATGLAAGVTYAVLAFLAWGLMPAYWKLIAQVPSLQLVAHRVVWSVLVTVALVLWFGRGAELLATLRSPRRMGLLVLTALLVSGNWLIFIWAVLNGHVLEASLGYFINPLLNVLLGVLLLKEGLRPWQALAVAVAALGVANLGWQLHALPWIALSLALTFGSYGLLRKLAPIEPLVGLTAETLVLLPLAGAFLLYADGRGEGVFLHGGTAQDLLIVGAGLITALPLLWFANAAKRLRLSTLGLLQYLAPSCQMALAVLAYGEPFTPAHAVTFGCIWCALGLYSFDAQRARSG
ncbi:chloramphenicol-sensitive protein RarD [Plasticicumulans lactativorans]|uniref:Chloramphenicol-sensitive protein RarD n=1 Tax=Plasticicumulans lactativorans TaxID=1133106 RepID=A0A4R2LG86_9GAMM|nr:EamA family transporter RarD [Plasticicumulans lactativorans]TCO83741.1 chloramphenicol-sensitive protein RarD [Plasticicumulans lactativorans]